MPTATYTRVLIDLATLNTNTGVDFDAGYSRYTSSGASSRDILTGSKAWAISDAGLAVPIISSPTAASVQQGAVFSYTITASDFPMTFGASGVPSPLSFVNGRIFGAAPESPGIYPITVSATNAEGTGNATLTLYVNATGAPVITSATVATGVAGEDFSTYQITATDSPTAWAADGLPAGMTCNSAGAITGVPSKVGTYLVSLLATNAAGTGVATLELTITIPGGSTSKVGGSSASNGDGAGCSSGAVAGLLLLGCGLGLNRRRRYLRW